MTKKVTAIVLALILGLSSMITAFAEEVRNDAQTEAITESTAEVTAKAGENAVFSVKTIGEVRSYQWQVSKNGGKKWTDLNPKTYGATETLTIPVKADYDGYLYRCEVTFMDYRVDHSAPAKLRLSKTLVLESESVGGVKVSVEAPDGALPEGTTMTVSAVNKAAVQNAVDKAADLQGTVLAAADITFYANGAVVEPTAPIKVTMTSEAIANAKNPQVIHLDTTAEDLEKSLVAPEKVDAEKELNAVKFEADQFSVYAVVEGEEIVTKQITFKFLDGEGNPYPFLNKAGQTVTEQIIKNGESLQEVPAPGLLGENSFNGWYYWNDPNWGEQVVFDVPITVTETKTVYIKAHYGDVIYVTFYQYAAGRVVLERKQIPANAEGKYIYDLSNVTVPAPKTTLKFMGWSLTAGTDASEDTGDEPNSRPLLPNADYEFTEDTDVYPVYYNGLWIVFISAQTGMGASYRDAYFLSADSANASAAKPEDPTMRGYAFDGWYTEAETVEQYTQADSGTAFNFNTAFANLSQYTNERGEVVLYGHWKGGSTTYVVVYWKQQVGNSKTATDAQKTYDYAGQTNPISSTTGTNPTPTTAQQAADTGFQYSGRYRLTDSEGNEISGIAADGSSILHVYFDRKLITMRFSTSTNIEYNGNWNGGNVTTYTGLYGQTWAQAGYTGWPAPQSGSSWQYFGTNNQMIGMTFLGQFVLPNNVRDTNKVEIRFRRLGYSNVTLHIIQQNVDGSYPTTDTFTGAAYGGTFNISDKFEGFRVAQYRNGNNDSWHTVTATTNSDGSHTYNPSTISNLSSNLYIRYARDEYEIKYLNPLNESPVLDPQTLLFGASLSSAKPSDSAEVNLGVAGYEWDGKWYKDRACTEEFDFATETMPMGGTKVYAGKTAMWFYIKIDPNGGELQTGQSTWRWVIYGDDTTYTYDNIERNYIEYKGTGTTYYYYYDEFDTSRRDDIWNYEYMASNPRTARYVTGSDQIPSGGGSAWLSSEKYSYEKDAYQLIGWYDITDPNNVKPFKTGTAITRDTIIQAQWRRSGEYRVNYSVEAVDENGDPLYAEDGETRVVGANSPVDGAMYADNSDSAVMDKMGVIPAGYNFVGWYYNGKVYEPGEVFQVLARLSDDQKVVHLYPVLEPVETLPVEVIDITFNPNGGVFTETAATELEAIVAGLTADETGTYAPAVVKNTDGTYTLKNLKMNESFGLLTAAAVENGVTVNGEKVLGRGYRLKEWNTKADGSGTSFALDTTVGVDEKAPVPNTVYAIWEELFYVYNQGTKKFTTMLKGDTTNRWELTTGFNKAGTADKTQYTTYYYGGFAVYAAGNAEAAGLTFAGGDVKTGTIADAYWTRAKAAKSADLWNTADTGAVYFIKEVPTSYLAKPVAIEIREDYGAGALSNLHFLSVTDTNIYREGGIKLHGDRVKGTFAKNFTLAQNNGGTTTITASDQFGLEGYLTIVNPEAASGTYSACQAYWITYDYVVVYGIEANIRDITIK